MFLTVNVLTSAILSDFSSFHSFRQRKSPLVIGILKYQYTFLGTFQRQIDENEHKRDNEKQKRFIVFKIDVTI